MLYVTMAKDFQLICSKKNSPIGNYDSSVGIYDLFQDELEELGPSNPYWDVQNPDENITNNIDEEEIEENSGNSSANVTKTPEVDGIPEIVRDLLKLLVNRASLNEIECNKDECGINATTEANESWSSSMVTPSKDKSDMNNSTLISFKLETSDLDNVSGSKNLDTSISLINLHQDEQKTDCENNESGSFYGFDPSACHASINSAIEMNSILHEKKQNSIYNNVKESSTNDFENLLLLPNVASVKKELVENSEHINTGAEQDKSLIDVSTDSINIGDINTVAEQDNSFLDVSINSIIIDESIKENEAVFMKSTPIKQCSLVNVCNKPVNNLIDKVELKSESKDAFMKEKVVSLDLEILGDDTSFQIKEKCSVSSITQTNAAIKLIQPEEKIEIQTEDKYIFDKVGNSFQLKDCSSDRLIHNSLPEISNIENIKDTCDMDTVILSGNNVTLMHLASSDKQEEVKTSNNVRKSEEVSLHDQSLDTKSTRIEPEYVSQVLDILCSPIASSDISRKKYVEPFKKKNEISQGLNNIGMESKILHADNKAILEESQSTEVRKMSIGVSHNAETEPGEVTILFESENVIENEELMEIKYKENEFYEKKQREMEKSHQLPDPSKTEVTNILQIDEPCEESKKLKPKHFCSKELFFDSPERKLTGCMANLDNNMPLDGGDTAAAPALKVFKEELISPSINSSSIDDCVVKIEPENDYHSQLNPYGSQDYLSYSVLEEVCKATEAIAYCGQVKNECVLDDSENEIEIVGSNIKVDLGKAPMNILESKMEIGKEKGIKNVTKNTESCIKYKKNDDKISVPKSLNFKSSQSDVIVVNVDSDNETVCKTEDDSEQTFRKKILFMAPECITLDDDIGWDEEFQFHNEMEKETQINNSDVANIVPKPVKKQQIPQPPATKETISSSCNSGVKVQIDNTRFVYPKKGKRLSHLFPKTVKPEDLMASAYALEKCSNVSCNKSKPVCQLKAKSLVSFDKLEISKVKEVKRQTDNISSDTYDISLTNEENSKLKKNNDNKLMDDSKIICSGGVTINLFPGVGRKETVVATYTNTNNDTLSSCQDIALECMFDNIKNQNEVQESGEKKDYDLDFENQNERSISPIFHKKNKIQKSFSRSSKYLNEKSSLIIKDGVNYGSPPNQNENQSKKILVIDIADNCNKIMGFPKELENFENPTSDDLKTSVKDELIPKSAKESKHAEVCKKDSKIENLSPLKINSVAFPVNLKKTFDEKDKHFFGENNTIKQELINYPVNCVKSSAESKRAHKIGKTFVVADSSTPVRDLPSVFFLPASGKKVGTSEKSPLKAKKLFMKECIQDDIENKYLQDTEAILSNMDMSGTDNVSTYIEDCYINELSSIPSNGAKGSTECRKTNIAKREPIGDFSTPARALGSVGFATASGKKVALSEKSLLQAKRIFLNESNEVDKDDQCLKDIETILSNMGLLETKYPSTKGKGMESTNTTANTSIKRSTDSRKTNIAKSESIGHSSTPARAPGSVGFATASGKKVAVSEKSMLQAKRLFLTESNEVDKDEQGLKDTESILSTMGLLETTYPSTNSNESTNTKATTSKKSSEECRETNVAEKKPIAEISASVRAKQTANFATTGTKKDFISERSLSQAKSKFLTVNNNDSIENVSPHQDAEEFSSNMSFLEGDTLLSHIEDPIINESNNTPTTCTKRSAEYGKSTVTLRELIGDSSTPARAPGSLSFATASGKKVAISEKSLSQAKRLFLNESNEVDKGNQGLKDTETILCNMGLIDRAYPSNESTDMKATTNIKRSAECRKTNIAKREPMGESSTPARAPGLVGFETASGKKVAISEKSLSQAKRLFLHESNEVDMGYQCLEDTETIMSNMRLIGTTFPSAEGKSKESTTTTASCIKGSADCRKITIANREFVDESLTPERDAQPVMFATTSGKKVATSEKSLQRAERDFLKEFNNNNIENEGSLQDVEEISSIKGLLEMRNFASHNDFSAKKRSFNSPERSTKISTELKKSTITKREPIDESSTPARIPQSFGFATASGKKVAISETSLLQAKRLFMNESNEVGKDDEGLKDTETIISNVDLLETTYPTTKGKGIESTNTTANTSIKRSTDSRKTNIAKMEPIGHSSTPARAPGLVGFETASGKKVAISEKSLLGAKILFMNESNEVGKDNQGLKDTETILSNMSLLETTCPSNNGNESTNTKATTSIKRTTECRKTNIAKREPIGDSSTPARAPGLVGFETASGKKVAISEKSLLQAKRLFLNESNEVDKGDQDLKDTETILYNMGLIDGAYPSNESTDNKVSTSIKRSAECRKTNIAKREPMGESSTPARAPKLVGFETASGKKVAISEKCLLQAKILFMNESNEVGIDDQGLKDTENILSNIGLLETTYPSTAEKGIGSNNTTAFTSIKRSKECRKTSVEKRDLIGDSSTPARAPGLVGFETASGKKVAISEKSLLQAKSLFMNESNEVGIDDRSLKETDAILSNIGLLEATNPLPSGKSGESTSTPASSINNLAGSRIYNIAREESIHKSSIPARVPQPVGNVTTSGKKVVISEKSLLQAKRNFLKESNKDSIENLGSLQDAEVISSNVVFLDQGNLYSDIEVPARNETYNVPVTGTKRSAERRKTNNSNKDYGRQPSSPLRAHQKGVFSTANGKEVAVSESSLLQAKKIFCDDSNPDDTKNRNSSAYGISENMAISSDISTQPRQHSVTLAHKNVNTCSNSKDKYSSPSKHEESKCKIEVESVISVSNKQHVNVRQMLNTTQELLFSESQGDNYIQAVDPKLLKSKDDVLSSPPPSPVLITSNRRKRSRQNISTSRKKRGNDNFKKSKIDSSATSPSNSLTSLLNCSQSSLSSTAKSEFPLRTTEDELWDNDLAEFSCLGIQLDLAEASNLSKENNVEFDHWSEARKRQNAVISSKLNVQPLIGRHFQERRCRGQFFKKSLRDLVQGKRPGRYNKDQLRKHNVRENALHVTSNNAAEFKFQLKEHYREMSSSKLDGILVEDGIRLIPDQKGIFGVAEAQAALLAAPGVDPKLLPQGGWCQNHYRWIVWKLASSERSFPKELGGRYLTPANVMRQLKYRWDREIDLGQRSAIRKILEKDDTSSKRMVLCVASIQKSGPINSSKKLELDLLTDSVKLNLTDGWYGIQGIIDAEMAALIQNGKVSVGTKLVTSGAELINSPPNGCHPLEPSASKAGIRLSTNSTRRARWDVKLGYVCKNPGPLPVTIRSLLPGGNSVGALKNVLLARTYPIVNVEKTSDGRKIIRSQRAEAKAAANHERQRQIWMEDIYSQVSAEIQKEEDEEVKNRQQRKRKISLQIGGNTKHPRRSLDTYEAKLKPEKLSFSLSGTIPPEELLKYIEESGDPSGLQSMLTSSQLNTLAACKQDARERRQRELEDRVRQRLKEEEEKLTSGNSPDVSKKSLGKMKRDVVALLKVRLVDADKPVPSKSAVLTIWRPSEEIADIFSREGAILTIYGVSTKGIRSSFLQLSSNRQTKYRLKHPSLRSASNLLDAFPTLKRVILHQGFDDYSSYQGPGALASYSPPFGEIDLVALVLKVGTEPNKEKGQGFQNVYMVGSDGSLMSIAFWGGIQEFAVEDIIQPGAVVVATNLQWRRNHGLCRIPTVHAVETSTFTRHPGEERLTTAIMEFQNEFKNEMQSEENRPEYLQSCKEKLDLMIGCNRKDDNQIPPLVKKSFPVDSGPSNILNEKCVPVTPSVLNRMKKLQMYEGTAEISLPVQHLRTSPAVMKAFRLPVRSPLPKPLIDLENKVTHSDNDSSPMSLDSDV